MRRGVSLVELMLAMVILTIVCIAWLKIIGIQSARKEARRREAVERLAGLMDAFMYTYQSGSVTAGSYHANLGADATTLTFAKDANTNVVHAVYESGESPIGYQLIVMDRKNLSKADRFSSNWKGRWLVGCLYESTDLLNKPFFSLPVCMGQ